MGNTAGSVKGRNNSAHYFGASEKEGGNLWRKLRMFWHFCLLWYCVSVWPVRLYLPLSDWGFRKYGTTLVISVKDNYEDSNPFGNASRTFETSFGRDYNSNGFLNASTEAFARIADSREDFYILDTTSGDGVVTEGILHLTDSAYTGMDTLLTDGKMKKFCRMSKNNQLIGYTISITYSPPYAWNLLPDC